MRHEFLALLGGPSVLLRNFACISPWQAHLIELLRAGVKMWPVTIKLTVRSRYFLLRNALIRLPDVPDCYSIEIQAFLVP